MSCKLLPHQEVIYNKIMQTIEKHNVLISGITGCGKTEVLNFIFENAIKVGYTPVMLDGGKSESNAPYYPFLLGLNEKGNRLTINTLTSTLTEDSPILPNTLKLIHKWTCRKLRKSLDFLEETEKEICDKLAHMNKKTKLLILCDNIQYWDVHSLRLLQILFTNKYLYQNITKNIMFVFSYTQGQETENENLLHFLYKNEVCFHIDFPELALPAFVDNLRLLGLNKQLKKEEYEILYNLIGGHIQVMIEVVREINNNRLDFDKTYQSNIELLKPILKNRLDQLGALGQFVDEALQYASLLGIKFDKLELSETLEHMDNSSFDFSDTLYEAENIHLIKNSDELHYSFVHEIIMQVFESEIPDRYKHKYYAKLANCLKKLKPHDYLRRAYTLLHAQHSQDTERIFALYLVQQFKEGSEIGDATFSEIKEHLKEMLAYVCSMKQAYSCYHKKEYTKAYHIAFAIPELYSSDLLAERDILLSCCQTKIMDASSKKDAVDILLKYDSIIKTNDELDVYENVLERLIICYIHYGDIQKAREYEEKYVLSISKRIQYDQYSKYRLYRLYRKANALYGAELAYIKMNQSTEYFASAGFPANIKDLYIALTNLSCVLIEKGEFSEAYTTALKGINLEEEYPNLVFPRTQIIKSNFCIAGVLSNNLDIEYAIETIRGILKSMPIIPERIFHVTNLSSLYALYGDVDKALELIETESTKQNYNNDIEGVYKYYICYNKLVFNYLLKNDDLNKLLKELFETQDTLNSTTDGTYLAQKNRIVANLIERNIYYTCDEWQYAIQKEEPVYQNSNLWKYAGLGYAFVSMNNWE